MFALEPDAIDPLLELPDAPVLPAPVEDPVLPAPVAEPVLPAPAPVELDPAPPLYDVLPVPPDIVPVTWTRCPTYCLRFWSLPPVSRYVFPAILPAPDVPVLGLAPVAEPPVVEPLAVDPVAEPVEDPVLELPVAEPDDMLPPEPVEAFVRM